MILTLEPLKAAEGDCLLLHFGTQLDPKLAIIDGGPGTIYETSLLPRLEQLRQRRGGAPLRVELVMLSHVDNDHAVGIKKLFRRLQRELEDGVAVQDRILEVRRLWHNTFNDILDDSIDQYYRTLTASLQASINGAPSDELARRLAQTSEQAHGASPVESAEIGREVALILAGHAEGREIRDSHAFLLDRNAIATLNAPFLKAGRPQLITNKAATKSVDVAGLAIRVVGPMKAEIEALQKAFDEFIADKGLNVEAMLAAYSDKSVPNLSSIVCMVEAGGKRILLTGDARGDKVIEGLTEAGLLAAGQVLDVDVLKVPHHGSSRNTTAEYFQRIRADSYVFSGNGKHGNPDRDTVEWVIASRHAADVYGLVFTYPIKEIDAERKREALKKGHAWKPADDSIASLLRKRKKAGDAFTVIAGAPVKIDLGTEPALD